MEMRKGPFAIPYELTGGPCQYRKARQRGPWLVMTQRNAYSIYFNNGKKSLDESIDRTVMERT